MAVNMIQQHYAKLDLSSPQSSNQEDPSKVTRLAEVKKGADYTKMVNTLAEEQWRGTSVIPRIVETEDVSPSKKVPSSFRYDEPQLLQTSTPIKPIIPPTRATPLFSQDFSDRSTIGTISREIRNVTSSRSSLRSYSELLNEHTEVMNKIHRQRVNVNNNNNRNKNYNSNNDLIIRRQHLLPDIAERDPKTSIDLEELYFNPWGSRNLGMDSKLAPDEPRARAYNHHVPSSRVAMNKHKRDLRTETDFRSRNGLVRVVKPPKPLPPISSFQYPQTGLLDDPENIGREKTYVTLKRIDRILNPQQMYTTGELNSSEIEILGSGSSSPVSNMDKAKEALQPKHATYLNHAGGVTVVHTYPMTTKRNKMRPINTAPHQKKQPYPKTRSMSPLLKTLESEKITSYEKCSKWVDKCSEWY
ncbi:hypothetical protein LOTGIDRAFT_171572 [Lottia gigantea]|uniref:Uncharacterized protein n=1 Tax=Lottia gigantea TaxID=225164 RepID=V4B044_LOTGI|nr:hypothetical protein LOTGIDRAFT_171572 [Lottia gigantea]ESP03338.1 hypothetical protein LOTGIDRAFT_171572 [Lottia gigantea]